MTVPFVQLMNKGYETPFEMMQANKEVSRAHC